MSGPLLDRIDLQVEVPAVEWEELRAGRSGPTSAEVRERVREARERAARRLAAGGDGAGEDRAEGSRARGAENGGRPADGGTATTRASGVRGRTNADMGTAEVRRHCSLGPEAEALVRRGVEEHGLTARGYHRLLKVTRTVADLEGKQEIGAVHVAEALQYRLPPRRAPR